LSHAKTPGVSPTNTIGINLSINGWIMTKHWDKSHPILGIFDVLKEQSLVEAGFI
jgi:hypothetical protein